MALGKVVEPEESEQEEEEGSNSDSSSGCFGFAAKPKKRKEKDPKDSRAKKRQSADAVVVNQEGEEKPAGKTARNGGSGGNKDNHDHPGLSGKISKAKGHTDFLEGVTALSIWSGTLKRKDLDSKLTKSYEVAEQLMKSGVKEGELHGKALLQRADMVSNMSDALLSFQNKLDSFKNGDQEALNVTKDELDRFNAFSSDCKNAVLTEFGRKLTEAS